MKDNIQDIKAHILQYLKMKKKVSHTSLKYAVGHHGRLYNEAIEELVRDGLIIAETETVAKYWRATIK